MGRHDYEAPSKPSLTREEVAEAVEAVGALQSRSRTLLGLVLISLALNGGLIAFIAYGMTRAARDRAAAASYVGPVVATQFTLIDPAGKVRGEMSINEKEQPTLELTGNEQGRAIFGFQGSEEDFAYMELHDRQGRQRILATTEKDGAEISLMTPAGPDGVKLTQFDQSGPSVTLSRSKDDPIIQLSVTSVGGAAVEVFDKEGNVAKEISHGGESKAR